MSRTKENGRVDEMEKSNDKQRGRDIAEEKYREYLGSVVLRISCKM